MSRMRREEETIRVMIGMYCRDNHGEETLCRGCAGLQEYALIRLNRCKFQEGKTTCAKCPVHCFKPEMRAKVRRVMRYAGPRMIYRYPWKTVMHLLDGRRKEPVRSGEVTPSQLKERG